ncbi:hypothetical protein G3480_22820 [Thiorhodococcus mannitoliphagus]|uniref:Uncharacterized protein n=1 Tax=Thiorhodococcus mannitoliphagus TaxID=329406 RepID=A0A6P1E201_9GAMM|nr:hypothetical protein [Thiorhodococcus mannitoliphagus]NEX23096.1 hypothetical protein [Thiorhodococcus mannitoliphagus]
MEFFFWRKTSKRVETFAVELATDFFSQVSPDTLARYFRDAEQDKKIRKVVESQIHNLVLRLSQFKDLHKVGVYGKARFHQAFMTRLNELGYENTAVKELNNLLMVKTP